MCSQLYRFTYDQYGNTSEIAAKADGNVVLHCNYTNKSTAFSSEERAQFNIEGLLPPGGRDLAQQVENCKEKLEQKKTDVDKYIFIRSLFDRNATLAHAVIASDIEKYMGVIYTPTVGLAVQKYSTMFQQANGLHFSPENIDRAEEILSRFIHRDIRVAVVTDNQGILGIGDQGVGGIAICLGKLMLYTQGAGIAPWHCLPISLDVGTNNKELLEDRHYIGWRHERLVGEEYFSFVDKFAKAFAKVFPNALCQWEDFSKQNAFGIRDSYKEQMISFNDDIQGTGSVCLAGILSAMNITEKSIKDQVFLIHGAGAGGVGIGEQIEAALIAEGVSEEEAKDKIFTLDSRGVVTTDRDIEAYKKTFAKDKTKFSWLEDAANNNLETVITKAGVTVLIGTSGQGGCFTEAVIKSVLGNTETPIVLPLSNPTIMTEALPEDIIKWTDGKALVATGSPFDPVDYAGKTFPIGQCNNVFVFPGVGLGILAAGAKRVLPQFFTAAAHAVSEYLSEEDKAKGLLLPNVADLAEISEKVALAVALSAVELGEADAFAYGSFDHKKDETKLKELISQMRWTPKAYLPMASM